MGIVQGKHIEIEIKTGSGRLSKHQQVHRDYVHRAGGIYIIARDVPADFDPLYQLLD